MIRFLKKLWHIPLFLGATIAWIILACLLNYIVISLNSFYEYKKRANPGIELNFERLHHIFRNHVRKDFYSFFQPPPPKSSKLDVFYITIDRKDIDSLNSELPESGKTTYYPAYLKINDEDQIHKIDLRYRGDSFFHWLFKKKSLRIKTPPDDLIYSHRRFNLVNLPHAFMINEVVNYQVSREAGLLAPDFFPVMVYLNNEYFGVYYFLSQIDESLLRRQNRMPGSIYSGDNIVKEDNGELPRWFRQQYKQGTSILRYKGWWKKISSRNREQQDYTEDLSTLVDLLNETDKVKFYQKAQSLLALEKISTFLAFDAYTGSHHHDMSHNHKVYFDPYKGRYEWIQWDLRYWNSYKKSKDLAFNPLLVQFTLNPLLEHMRDKRLFELLDSYPFSDIYNRMQTVFSDVVDETMADKYRDTLLYDIPFHPKGYSTIYSLDEFQNEIQFTLTKLKERHIKLSHLLASTNAKFHLQKLPGNRYYLTFGIAKNSGITLLFEDILQAKELNPNSISIYRDIDGDRQIGTADTLVLLDEEELLLPGRKLIEGNALNHENLTSFGDKRAVPHPLYYSYIITGLEKLKIEAIPVRNAITKKTLEISKSVHNRNDVEKFMTHVKGDSIHPWKLPNPDKKTIVLKGDIEFSNTKIFNKNVTVLIEPNTKIRLGPDASLVFYGKVLAEGKANQPIEITRAQQHSPWGAIVLQGKNTTGSILSFVHTSGGSKASMNLIKYPGQVNIHNTNNILINNCVFKNNSSGDDNLHLAYFEGTVNSSIFLDSHMDALDVDLSSIVINDSIFFNSGNDSLDLMTSEVTGARNLFQRSGDKCISVGENSTLKFTNSYLNECNIGIEVKDQSQVDLSNIVIRDSRTQAINLYNKNKQYDGGGNISGNKIYLVGNVEVGQDERSSIDIQKIYNNMPNSDFFLTFSKNKYLFDRGDYHYEQISK